ncbi:DUF5365 family protein [Bacillus xiapuensis]|uniref:DUF5365 family protein n=1 Tax=Bacillus xiapuensis TaxID=2014075 RepID=UPI000C238167|nr:DUF5365 family protein [Bacillus xiapuensis]
MRVLMASTVEQEEKIFELIKQLKEEILPRFLTKEERRRMDELGILELTDLHMESFSILRDAFSVIASLQTIISILELEDPDQLPAYYQEMFQRNIDILRSYGIRFPFLLSHFSFKKRANRSMEYAQPANTFLI